MEIRINKEIKDYHESLFMGLSMRQFMCSLGAVGAAVGIYFGLKGVLDKETVSWLCIVCAAPLAAAGFFNYIRFYKMFSHFCRCFSGECCKWYGSKRRVHI